MHKIDLHMHSSYSSDGEFSPERLIALCDQEGITLASLTDHNSVKGVEAAEKAASASGIQFITGTELNCQTEDGVVLHILGYGVDHFNPIFDQLEDEVNDREERANYERIPMLRDLGIIMEDGLIAQVKGDKLLVCEMLAEAALMHPANREHPLLQPFLPGGARSEKPFVNFFWDVCTAGKAAYIPVVYRPIKEIIRIIHENGGLAVLAHPAMMIGKDLQQLEEIIASGVEGIEVYSSYHSVETIKFYEDQAKTRKLGMTVGSDFHGRLKPDIQLGSVDCNGHEEEILDFLAPMIRRSV